MASSDNAASVTDEFVFDQVRRPLTKTAPVYIDVLVWPFGHASHMLAGINRYARTHGRWRLRWRDASQQGWDASLVGEGVPVAAGTLSCMEPSKIEHLLPMLSRPLVAIHQSVNPARIPVVKFDEPMVGRMGARFLIERGFRDLAFYGCNEDWSHQREAAFYAEAERHGCCTMRQSRRQRPATWKSNLPPGQLEAYVLGLPTPIGAMACCDAMGAQLIEAAENANRRVPQEIAVLGVDNNEIRCQAARVPMSSVETDIEGLGFNIAKLLDELIAGKPAPSVPPIVPPRRIVARESTDIVVCDDPDLSAALSFIAAHVNDGITREDVARQSGLSLSTLERLFRKNLNRSPGAELRRQRLARACELLIGTDLSLADVATRSGMGSASSLVQAFQRAMNTTPGAYRQRHRG